MLKKLIFVFLVIGSSGVAEANDAVIRKTIAKYLAAWGEHDMKKVSALYVDNISLYDLPTNSYLNGKKEVVDMETKVWLESTPDMIWARTGKLHVSGDIAIYEWIWTGTFTGMWEGRDVKGKKFTLPGLSMTKVNKAGMIVEQRDYYDMYSFQQQIGVLN